MVLNVTTVLPNVFSQIKQPAMSTSESSTLGDEQQVEGEVREAPGEASSAASEEEEYEPPRVEPLGTLPSSTGMAFSFPDDPGR